MYRVGYILCSSISASWNSSCICCSTEKLKHYFSQKLELVLLIASLFISQYLCKFLEIPPNLLSNAETPFIWNGIPFFFSFETLSLLFNHFIQFLGLFSLLFEKIAFAFSINIPHTFKLHALFHRPAFLFAFSDFRNFYGKY